MRRRSRPPTSPASRRWAAAVAIQNRMAFAGEVFAERYGKAAAASAPPLRRLLDAGIPIGAGTDATRVSSHNPWLSLSWMVAGKTVGGTQLASPENRLTREEALRLYTIGSAWFSGEEGVKGRIAPGQYADFAVLSDDYFAVAEERIRSIESVLTVVGGDVVYAAPPFHPYAPAPLPPGASLLVTGGSLRWLSATTPGRGSRQSARRPARHPVMPGGVMTSGRSPIVGTVTSFTYLQEEAP